MHLSNHLPARQAYHEVTFQGSSDLPDFIAGPTFDNGYKSGFVPSGNGSEKLVSNNDSEELDRRK